MTPDDETMPKAKHDNTGARVVWNTVSGVIGDDTTRIAAIQARVEAATKGPWRADGHSYTIGIYRYMLRRDGGVTAADAEFIAHARQDIPWLLARDAEHVVAHARLQAERDEKDYELGLTRERLDELNQPNVMLFDFLPALVNRLYRELSAAEAARDEALEQFRLMSADLLQRTAQRDEALRSLADLRLK
jgi:hypothetical protein